MSDKRRASVRALLAAGTTVVVLANVGCAQSNRPPRAKARALPPIAETGRSVRLDGSLSSDPDGRVSAYAWDLGDGQKAQGKVVRRSYRKTGVYQAKLVVKDERGASGSDAATVAVIVRADPPPQGLMPGSEVLDASEAYVTYEKISPSGRAQGKYVLSHGRPVPFSEIVAFRRQLGATADSVGTEKAGIMSRHGFSSWNAYLKDETIRSFDATNELLGRLVRNPKW